MSSHFLFAEVVYWYPSEAGNCLFFFHEPRVLRNTCKTSFALGWIAQFDCDICWSLTCA